MPPLITRILLVPLALASLIYILQLNGVSSTLLAHFGYPPARLEITKSATRAPFTRRIVAVGDLHGDLLNAMKVLTFSSVLNPHGEWSGEIDYFVQTGDIIDRGDDTIPLFKLMDRIREEAPKTGGIVVSHLGNHEWMNVIGDWRYVYPTEIQTFHTPAKRQHIVTQGWLGQTWLHNYTTASRIPFHPSLGGPNTPYPNSKSNTELSHSALSFVHGGISPTLPSSILTPYPESINTLAKSLLIKLIDRHPQPPPHPPSPYPGLPSSATREEERIYDSEGPVWYRGWALDEDVCDKVELMMKEIGVRRIIMGHTPDFHGITSRCGSKIIIIDTGISKAYGGVLSALDIMYTLTPAEEYDSWIEREIVTAVYQDRREVLVDESREVRGEF